MKIITCYKCVPDEQDIAVNNADGSLDFSKADAKISQYDLNAIEAACQLKQQAAEAQVTALSVGGKALTNAKGRKDVLSDAPRDKCTLSCAINGIHAAFHYLKKNYISGCVMTVPTG